MSYTELTPRADVAGPADPTARAAATAALGIGALSKATGIPVETLRTWERRYGFPHSERDVSGQRTYELTARPRLQLIRQALELGLRAARVVPLPLGELERLLRETPALPTQAAEPSPTAQDGPTAVEAAETAKESLAAQLERWLELTVHYDGTGLASEMARAWNHMGAVAFLDRMAGPFMAEVGRRWADGRLGVAHEHFATEQLRSQMNAMVAATSPGAPALVCATLPGELHALGLQMAAVTAQVGGMRVIYLGADVPLIDLARAAEFSLRNGRLCGVIVSISRSVEQQHARDQLSQLRSLLPDGLPLLVGGSGAPSGVGDVHTMGSLLELLTWTRQWAAG
jgi:DNA-binding transcriptional MerR regulator/methylmalonyl-CoA mutase cobalamin-binding subunit